MLKILYGIIFFMIALFSFGEESGDYSLDYLTGKYTPSKNSFLVKIPSKYCDGGKEIYGHKDVVPVLIDMINSAERDGVNLKIISGVRTFYHQKSIWERKWSKFESEGLSDELEIMKKILLFSSMPGTSRHHWGTDFDFNSLEDSYFQSGKGKREYEWLVKNGANFGFCQVYKKENKKGYSEEKWHWSYMKVSEEMLKQYIEKVGYINLAGFKGDKNSSRVRAIEDYVSTISRK